MVLKPNLVQPQEERVVNNNTKPVKSSLFKAIKARQWAKAKKILESESNHNQATYSKDHGCVALHLACLYRDTPFELIESLLIASPIAVAHRDNRGETPLRVALEHAPDKVVISLVKTNRDALSIEDSNANTPLEFAIKAEKSTEVIRAILQGDPSVLREGNNMNKMLKLFFARWSSGLREVMDKLEDTDVSSDELCNVDVPNPVGTRKVKEIFEKGCLLLRYSGYVNVPVLHCSIVSPFCPWSFIQLILKMYPEQAWKEDMHGNLPLDLAMSSKLSICDAEFYICRKCRTPIRSRWYQHKMHNVEIHDQYCERCESTGLEDYFFIKDDYKLMIPIDKIKATVSYLTSTPSPKQSMPQTNQGVECELLMNDLGVCESNNLESSVAFVVDVHFDRT